MVFNYRESAIQGELYKSIKTKASPLSDFAKVTTGIKPYQVGKGIPKQTKQIVDEKPFTSYSINDGWKPLIRGTQVNRYTLEWDNEFINYGIWLAEPRTPEIFFKQKILIRRTDDRLLSVLDNDNYIGVNSVHIIQSIKEDISNKYLIALINSSLLNWYFQHENFHMVGKPLAEVKVVFVERLPIVIDNNQLPYIQKADHILLLNKELQELSNKFKRTIQRKFPIKDLPNKLQNWYLLSYNEFIVELGKKKVKLSLIDEAEWEGYFLQESKKALEIKAKIETTDKEIDVMVYQLYGLTEKEIEIVENS